MASDVRPFKVDIPQQEVDRLSRKLRDTRLPGRSIVPNAGDRYGMWALSQEAALLVKLLQVHRMNGQRPCTKDGSTTLTGSLSRKK